MAATFDTGDVELLLDLYHSAGSDGEPRRPPWTWAALKPYERDALLRMCAEFVESYNRIHAVKEDELIPPCWVLHHELAAELAVQVWLYYFAHLDTKATPALAGDYYGRHLPGFRQRDGEALGGGRCRADTDLRIAAVVRVGVAG